MKRLFFLVMSGLSFSIVQAQNKHLVTIAELKAMALCSDQNCFLATVNPLGFQYKSSKKGTLNRQEGTQYRYVRPYPNPLFSEATASYWIMADGNRQIVFTSDNKDWTVNLKNAIKTEGFLSVDSDITLTTTEEDFQLTDNERIWYLHWTRRDLMGESGTHSLTIRYEGTPAGTSAVAVVGSIPSKPNAAHVPHLGGDWDEKYPTKNVAEIFRAERIYATDYERKHGKTGHTFSRVEKMRIQATYLNQRRPLTADRWQTAFDLALRRTGFDAFADERTQLYKQEALYDIGGERVWMPTQEMLFTSLRKEAINNVPITLYSVLVSHHDFGGTLHLSFLVNEFAAPEAVIVQAKQEQAEESPYAQLIKEKSTSSNTAINGQRRSTDCGFNWKPWSSVTVAEREPMKRIMVTQYEAAAISLLQLITNGLREGNTVQIAQYRFFNKPSYVVYQEYKTRQGDQKGQVDVIVGQGESYLWPSVPVKQALCSVQPVDKPKQKGVIDDSGQLTEFMGSLFFDREYANFLKTIRQSIPAKPAPIAAVNQAFVGGKTPEQLCLVLLKALKTNDKVLWMRCMHPANDVEDDTLSARRFDMYRDCLDANGITDWTSVAFSRLTHAGKRNVDVDTFRSWPKLEFTYKQGEFVGIIHFASFLKQGDTWLLRCGESHGGCQVSRSMR